MKILVTGGDGLVGRPLCGILGARHEVTAPALDTLDVTDGAAVMRTLDAVRPERVVHLAAWTDVDGCERDPERALLVNGDGARNVAEACARIAAPLLHVSTDYVFDGRKAGPWVETDPTGPLSAYGRSKLAAEVHVAAAAPRWTIVRAQSLYGEGGKSFPDAILARAAAGGPLSVVTDQRVSPTWAVDLATAIAALLSAGSEGIFHVANSGSCTWHEFARAVLDLAGLAGVPVAETTAAALGRPAPRPANSAFDCTRFEVETGTTMRPWRAALAAYLATVRAREERP